MQKGQRLFLTLICCATVVVLCGEVLGQEAGTTSFFFSAGPATPSSEQFSESWSFGFDYSAGVERQISDKFSIRGTFGFTRFGLDKAGFIDNNNASGALVTDGIAGGALSILTGFIGFKYGGIVDVESDTRAAPYVLIQAGFLKNSKGTLNITERFTGTSVAPLLSTTKSTIGFAAGGGIHVRLKDRVALFFDVGYEMGLSSASPPQNNNAVLVAGTTQEDEALQYVPFRIGLMFSR